MKPLILVTGGTGYIGSHTVVELQQEGYYVIIVDNLSNSNIHVLDGIEKITGKRPLFENFDLCNEEKTQAFFSKNEISAVIHFAAYKAVGESVELPLKYYKNNFFSLVNLLSAMKEHQVKNFVFSSSCTVYGQPDELPVTENAPVKQAISPYGNTKQVSEEIIHDYIASDKEFKSILLRYFNPIGAHESAIIGELPIGIPNNLVPFITQTAIGLRNTLKVFGNNYNTPDGTCIRDYINVTDLAKAHVISLKRLLSGVNKNNIEIFNLGTGKGCSVLEIINIFEKATNQKLNFIIADRRPGDIEKVFASTEAANKILGWKAEKSMEETLLTAWNWEKNLSKNRSN